jgi:hypothetical protein
MLMESVSFSCSQNSAIEPCCESFDSCLTCFHNIFLVIFYKSFASMAWHAVWVVNGQNGIQIWKNMYNKQSISADKIWPILKIRDGTSNHSLQ